MDDNTESGTLLTLYHGAQRNDEADYPDCRPSFIEAAQSAVDRSTDQHTIRIRTPLIDRSKVEVLRLGEQLGVDWEHTFSCYNDVNGEPCGNCPACIEREEAFEAAGITDPLS